MGQFLGVRGGASLANVKPEILDIVKNAIAAQPYPAQIISGSEPRYTIVNGKRVSTDLGNHGPGYALDVQLYKPDANGNLVKLPNEGTAAYSAYEAYAQAAKVFQQQKYPNLPLRTGLGFETKPGSGILDPMHLDIRPGAGMSSYSWDKGGLGQFAQFSNGGLAGPNGAKLASQYQTALASGIPTPSVDVAQSAPTPLPRPGWDAAFSGMAPNGTPLNLTASAYAPPLPQADPRSPALDAINKAAPTSWPDFYKGILPAPKAVPQITDQASAADFYRGILPDQKIASLDPMAGMSASGQGTAPSLTASSAPPVPMDRLRVALPGDELRMAQKLLTGSNVHMDRLPQDQQLALLNALPTVLGMQPPPGSSDGQKQDANLKTLKYLQDNNLYDPMMKVVPTNPTSPQDRFLAGLFKGANVPDNVPAPLGDWNLSKDALNTLPLLSSTDPQTLRRPIGQNGLPQSNATLDPISAPSSSSWAAPYLSRSIESPSPLPGSSGSSSYGNAPATPPPLPGASGSSRYGNIVAPPLPIPRPTGGGFGPMEMAANTTGSAFGGVSPGASASSSASIASPSALAWARINSPGDLRGDVAPAPYNPSPIVPQSVYPLPPPSNYNAGYMNLGGKHPSAPPAPLSPYGAPPSISPYGAPQSISPYGAPDPIYGTDITPAPPLPRPRPAAASSGWANPYYAAIPQSSFADQAAGQNFAFAADNNLFGTPVPPLPGDSGTIGSNGHPVLRITHPTPLPVPAAPPPPPPPDFRGSSTQTPYWVGNTYAGRNGYTYNSVQRPDGTYGFVNAGETPAAPVNGSGSAFYGGGIAPQQSAGDMFGNFVNGVGTFLGHTAGGAVYNLAAPHLGLPTLGGNAPPVPGGGMLHGLLGNILGQAPPVPSLPFAPLNAAQLSGANPNYVAAYNSGQSSYQPTGAGGFVPTQTVGGGGRNSYGDATNGLGQSLTSTF